MNKKKVSFSYSKNLIKYIEMIVFRTRICPDKNGWIIYKYLYRLFTSPALKMF